MRPYNVNRGLFDQLEFGEGVCFMKKRLPVICAGIGGAMIGHWAWYLDTIIGCLFFTLGIILLVGSWIADARNKKKDKEEK